MTSIKSQKKSGKGHLLEFIMQKENQREKNSQLKHFRNYP